jgi:hypothetical protein
MQRLQQDAAAAALGTAKSEHIGAPYSLIARISTKQADVARVTDCEQERLLGHRRSMSQ